MARCQALGFATNEGRARWTLADILITADDLDAADREFATAIAQLEHGPLDRAGAVAVRARLRLAQGRAAEALADVKEGLDVLTKHGAPGFRGEYVRLIYAEALHATGDRDGAAQVIAAARDIILAHAEQIAEPDVRRRFLESVPEHRRTLALAAELPVRAGREPRRGPRGAARAVRRRRQLSGAPSRIQQRTISSSPAGSSFQPVARPLCGIGRPSFGPRSSISLR